MLKGNFETMLSKNNLRILALEKSVAPLVRFLAKQCSSKNPGHKHIAKDHN